jgi:hypothetical protein
MCSHGQILQRYFNHNRLCVIEVCQTVNRDAVFIFVILWCVCGGGGGFFSFLKFLITFDFFFFFE